MAKFEIPAVTEMLCIKFQTRSENHGEAKVTAADLRVRWTTKNTALDMLHSMLREAVCSALPDQESDQGELEMEASDLAFVRFKKLSYPLHWEHEFTGYTARIDHGMGGEGGSDYFMKSCKVGKINFTPIEGGLCDIEFTISSSADIDQDMVGYLGMKQQQKVFLSLLPPVVKEGAVIDASNGSGAPGTGEAQPAGETPPAGVADGKKTTPTDAFVAAHKDAGQVTH